MKPAWLTRIHGQHLVVAEQVGDVLLVFPEHVVVEGPRGQGQRRRLFFQRVDEPRMAVALVDGGVGRQHVVVAFALDVPDVDAFAATKGHRQRAVVMGAVFRFAVEDRLSFGRQGRGAEPRSAGGQVAPGYDGETTQHFVSDRSEVWANGVFLVTAVISWVLEWYYVARVI